jgi:hypothetical protein
MSERYPGGLITKTPVTPSGPYETSTASGIWTLEEQAYWRKLNQWPIAGSPVPDAQFNYVTMLLHGDGTNGAQNNTFLDSSTNAFSITRNGNTTQGSFSPYGSNWSNYFDGASYLETTSSSIVPAGSFTVECLVYLQNTNNQAFVAQGVSGNIARFSLAIDGGLWFAQIGGNNINAGTPIANTWTYLAVTFNGTTLTLYVNGTSVGSVATSTSAQATTLAIGTYGTSWVTSGYFLTGYISNVRISNVVRTISTPTAPYISDANTTALFCQSNRFKDSSSNNYTINVQSGAPSVQRFNPFGASTAYSTSVIGGSGYFDGAGDSLTVGNPSVNAELALGANNFTIQAWVYPLGTGVYTILSSLNNSTGNGSYWFQVNGTYSGGGTLQFGYNYVFGGSGGTDILLGTGTLAVGAWSFVAITRDGANVRGYVNGVQVGATNTSIGSRTIYPTNATELIGKNTDSDAFAMYGYLSNVELVNGTALYTGSTMTVPTAPSTLNANTELLTYFTNGAIYDNAMMNDLETVGNAQISTSVVKYGTGSMYFDGTGDGLIGQNTPNISLSGNFTIEAWVYQTDAAQNAPMISIGNASTSNGILLFINTSQQLGYFINSAGNASGSAPINTWHHIAVVRSGSTITTYLNGVGQNVVTYSATFSGAPYFGAIVYSSVTYYGAGYMDDLRITKGYARYTTTFTPPTAAFPNIGPT